MRAIAAIGAVWVWLLHDALATDYCRPDLCPEGTSNIACKNNANFVSQCVKPRGIKLSAAQKSMVTDLHNKMRSDIACGKISGYGKASRMGEMAWDQELEHMASLNAKRCIFQHDECRNTDTYSQAGQNLHMFCNNRHYGDLDAVLYNGSYAWFNEYHDSSMDEMRNFTHASTNMTGHFTQICRDRSNRLGCYVSTFELGEMLCTYMVCDYATTNVLYRPIYKSGAPGSECDSGMSDNYKGLCKVHEKYLTDSEEMTIELRNAQHAHAEATATASAHSSNGNANANADANANANAKPSPGGRPHETQNRKTKGLLSLLPI